ncbi:MAG: hypothetical protein HY537_04140 [Deltaproteobacteria bacterium]|nr:hypothetical protein [Deltaproteobacteria bacterium]
MLQICFSLLIFCSVLGANTAVPQCADKIAQKSLKSLEAVAQKLHGGDPLHPTEKSLLGRYQKKTGAAFTIRTFPANPMTGERGPRKLVVAVSPQTFQLFFKMFGKEFPNLLEHLHSPRQGTLRVRWMTQVFSYAKPSGEWRFPTEGSIGPMILLSDSEALRLHDYFVLNQKSANANPYYARYPNNIPGYNYPKDAYSENCTTWFGHIPLGDETDEEVVCPGSLCGYGDNQGRAPRRGTLTDYPVPQNFPDGELLKKVWSVPLHKRLWDLLEIPFERANHTNPGWVALSLTGLAKTVRVPFIAYYTSDHTHIRRNFSPQIQLQGGVPGGGMTY